jgi:hypothetical protein
MRRSPPGQTWIIVGLHYILAGCFTSFKKGVSKNRTRQPPGGLSFRLLSSRTHNKPVLTRSLRSIGGYDDAEHAGAFRSGHEQGVGPAAADALGDERIITLELHFARERFLRRGLQ